MGAAGYRNPEATEYMARTLGERRDQIARRMFDEITPLEFFQSNGRSVTFRDLGNERGIYPGTSSRYRIRCAAVDENRSPAHWTQWEDLETTRVALDQGAAFEAMARGDADRYPFLALEVAVHRGSEWSPGGHRILGSCIAAYRRRGSLTPGTFHYRP